MRLHRLLSPAVLSLALVPAAVAADEQHPHPPAASTPAFDKMKTLVGSWEGTATHGPADKPTPGSKSSFKVVSGGSVLMNVLGEGTPHEMVTMVHLDGKELLATHYCAAQNQPRLKAVPPAAPNQLAFEFKDGTNIAPGDGHMQKVVFTFVDADHHLEDWTFRDGKGKEATSHFDFKRKK